MRNPISPRRIRTRYQNVPITQSRIFSPKKAINANFGWNDEIESCFTWSKNGTAIVNPECKVEIPKTGDASVVAYAVMALVAAAGAMGLKK